eukprot:CAMPEP_0172644264 /NCGR_PEP_ID=MMETSP1068-20121228/239117_1 /TAXON_ID=35684 /ORGANISM="Pseudopedinella elastica, Strain CCMP716" /LENGTH=163 /DNA_ID=CAMNT_0013458455 /DNA_START=839 /DNA_END=1330 /DNA_ORIENTATION=+
MVPGGIRYSFPGVTLGDINAVNGPNLPSPRHGPVTPIVGHCELEFDLPQDCGVLWEGDVKLGHVIDRVDNRPETLIALAFGHVVDEADVLKLAAGKIPQGYGKSHFALDFSTDSGPGGLGFIPRFDAALDEVVQMVERFEVEAITRLEFAWGKPMQMISPREV